MNMGEDMDSKVALQRINSIPLFEGFAVEEVSSLLNRVNALVKYFRKSDYIYLAGDCVENLCVVINGTVQVIKEDIWGDKAIIANLGSGSVFAENFLGKRGDRSIVSYFAASDSEILMIPFGKMLGSSTDDRINGKLVWNIVSVLADNNTKLIEKTEILCKKTLRGKILAYLEQEAANQKTEKIVVPFNRTDMANYLDSDRSALTRELAKMRDEDLIAFEKNVFEILKK